jgi:multiple sugar transport system ATP-binding protein
VYVTHDQEEAMTLGDRVVVMKDGITQQVGSALEIYNHPVNRFVASFLGSPPMNFFSGKLVENAGRLFFDEGTGQLPVPDWAQSELRARVGQELVLGVRPEAMSDKAHARFLTEDNQLNMKVTLVQPLGHKMDVYLATPQHPRSVAQIDSYSGVHTGESMPVFFDMQRVHFFEAGDNGRKLVRNTSAKE